MAYSHQKEVFQLFGLATTAGTPFKDTFLASGTGIKARHTFTGHKYILRSVSVVANVSSVTVGKPIITLRKASEPSTTTATGSAITGATLTFPATLAKGNMVILRNLHTSFQPGDHLVLQVSTAATKAFAMRAFAEAEPSWEYPPNTGLTTVTA